MPNAAPEPIRVSLNAGGTLSVPVEVLDAWKLRGTPSKVYFCREGRQVVIVLPQDLQKFLARQARSASASSGRGRKDASKGRGRETD